jgi:hypothetical protein
VWGGYVGPKCGSGASSESGVPNLKPSQVPKTSNMIAKTPETFQFPMLFFVARDNWELECFWSFGNHITCFWYL